MNLSVQRILLLFILAGIFWTVFAQEGPLPVRQTENKIILEGKVYYVHLVKEGETLSGISGAYNVTEKIIVQENPDILAGLVTGMALKIPAEPADVSMTPEAEEYFFHVIREGETLYSLAKKYNVELDVLKKHNPEVEYSELQINQIIKVPKSTPPEKEVELRDSSFNYHLVKQGETLYSLSTLYHVSIEEIKELNPALISGPLRYDEYIRIPVKPIAELVVDTSLLEQIHEPFWTDSIDESIKRYWVDLMEDTSSFKPVPDEMHVGLFLPLLLHWDELQVLADTLVEEEPGSPGKEDAVKSYHPLTIGFLEFYEGVLLAVDSLKRKGFSITLHTYDTEKNPDVVKDLLTNKDLAKLDLIIGPVDPRNVELVSDFAAEHRIPMISPFISSDELVGENPFLIQLQSSPRVQMENYADFISGYYDRTMIIIHSGDSSVMQHSHLFRNEILERISKKTSIAEVNFKEFVFVDSLPSDFTLTLTADTENIIIIPAVNEAEVSNILTSLYFLMENSNIKVFGMENWSRFRSIDLEYYHKLQLNYFTTFYVDYEKPEVVEFVRKFNNTFYTEPYLVTSHGYNLGMLAYDLMLYFCPAVKRYGKNVIFNLDQPGKHLMQGDYLFRQLHPFSGQVNQFTRQISYKTDLTIEQSVPILHRPPVTTIRSIQSD